MNLGNFEQCNFFNSCAEAGQLSLELPYLLGATSRVVVESLLARERAGARPVEATFTLVYYGYY